jgi:hypothetical protein
VRRVSLVVAGLIGVFALAGCAARPAPAVTGGAAAAGGPAAAGGSVRACAAYAYRAIERQQAVTGRPAACAGLSRAEVNQAASTAIRQAAGDGPKSAWRKQAGVAAPWVNALLTGQVPVSPARPEAVGGHAGAAAPGSGIGGVSELALKLSALLAWLATAASGGYILLRWLLAGGSPRRRSPTAVPPAVILGHAGFGLLGLVIWVVFTATGATAFAWAAVAIMAPVAGLGMGVLALGLPSPRPERPAAPAVPEPAAAVPEPAAGAPQPAVAALGAATATLLAPAVTARPASRPRTPVLAIAAHGLFAATALLLVLLAAVGAG